MYHKVKIKKLPNKAVGGGINGNRIVNNQLLSWGGADFNMAPQKPKVTNTITGESRDKSNLEAEGGETVYGDINGDGMAEHLTIKGPRHSSGGVPLNLPDGTFIFSDTKSMRIKDPKILANFGKKKGSYTPAELAKQYDISKFRKLLQDPDSDPIERKTAEIMIRNYNMKLGALAIVQESKKGFPQGLPEVSKPFLEAYKLSDEQFMPEQQMPQQGMPQQQQMPEQEMEMPSEDMMAQYGYEMPFAYGGSLNKYQTKGQTGGNDVYDVTDETLRPDVTGKGYKFVDPAEQYRYKKQTGQDRVGYQTKKGGYNVDPESGFWYKDVKPGTAGLEDFYQRHKDIINEYKGKYGTGKDAWVKEHLEAKGNTSKAMDYLINANNNLYGTIAPGKSLVDTKKKAWNVPGVELYNMPGIQKDVPADEPKDKETPEECPPCPDGSVPAKDDQGKCLPCAEEDEPKDEEVTDQPTQDTPAEWWLQDKLKVAGALRDSASIKKYDPLAPKVDLQAPNPVYLDPTRELAAQSEQSNLMAQGLGQFAGPQAFAANMSGMQGNSATQAANTLSKYNNANVNLANQFGWKAADVANQEQLTNQGITQRLYDQTTVANQQYDNAKRAARNNVLNQYISGVTNKEKTNALNQMYPNYKVDPRSGGHMNYKPGKQIKPTSSADATNYARSIKDLDPNVQKVMMEQFYANQGSKPAGADAEVMQQMYQKKKGGANFAYVMGANVFPPFFY